METKLSQRFFDAWIKVVNENKDELQRIWRERRNFTLKVKGSEDSILSEVSKILNLRSYEHDYYSIDAILYKSTDLVDLPNKDSYWFQNITIAIEHENDFKDGLYKEGSHLLITNAELRVLITYPDEPEWILSDLRKIITMNKLSQLISDTEGFLVIFGYENGFEWQGYVYKENEWKVLNLVQ